MLYALIALYLLFQAHIILYLYIYIKLFIQSRILQCFYSRDQFYITIQ